MLRPVLFTIITAVSLLKATVYASNIEVYGKKYYNNCSYATTILGQVHLSYFNSEIAQDGVKVYLHYGLNGFLPSDGKTQLEWNFTKDVEMTPAQKYLWTNTTELEL